MRGLTCIITNMTTVIWLVENRTIILLLVQFIQNSKWRLSDCCVFSTGFSSEFTNHLFHSTIVANKHLSDYKLSSFARGIHAVWPNPFFSVLWEFQFCTTRWQFQKDALPQNWGLGNRPCDQLKFEEVAIWTTTTWGKDALVRPLRLTLIRSAAKDLTTVSIKKCLL